jgi:hypothetical protein
MIGNMPSNATVTPTALSAVPVSSSTLTNTLSVPYSSVGANPRISTVDEEEYLEDLLDMDPV